ncbi:hypothetical protein BN1723_010434 [Verticillium longisporum]|uniref:Uncharacterized protein n=1 Tax=Verticillium longisporum TaxID=100787 RepID=A0A0G4KZ63_VERLO|nr:hypothetical protein BN1723_010434 [Verticillium longisporum]
MRCNIALAFGLGASTAMASSHFKAAARQPVYQRQAPGQSVSSDIPGPSSNYVCHGDECGHETCHGDECHNTKVYCQGEDCKPEEECHECKPAPVKPWTPEDEKTWNNKHTAEYPAQPQHPGQPQQPAKPVTPVNPAKPVTPTGNVYPQGDHVVVAGAEKAIASFGVIVFAAAALFL